MGKKVIINNFVKVFFCIERPKDLSIKVWWFWLDLGHLCIWFNVILNTRWSIVCLSMCPAQTLNSGTELNEDLGHNKNST